jgi:hypothetical protein
MSESSTVPGETERWLPVPGMEGLYEVSDRSRVRSTDRTVSGGHPGRRYRIKGHVLRTWLNASGVPAVTMWRDGRKSSAVVQLLVLRVFGVPPAIKAVPDAGEPERWLPVRDYEDLYEVSDLGRVRSFHAGRGNGKRGGLLRPALTGGTSPRLCIVLCRDGTKKTRLVHQLVLEAFVGPCPPGMESLHGPGGALDNRLANLSWDSHSANMMDKVRDGTSNRGTRQGQSRLTDDAVIEARKRYAAGEPMHALAAEFGVSGAAMSNAVSGKNWSWLPGAVPVDHNRHGTKGTAHHAAKLTPEIVREARRRNAAGESQRALAAEYGVKQPTLQKAITGATWRNVA